MSYVANQYNHATPLSSAPGLISGTSVVADNKYFTLFDNKLDGSYYPITSDVGLWGTSLSDNSGILAVPYILTITDNMTIRTIRIVGSQYCYPVAFSVVVTKSDDTTLTFSETNNGNVVYEYYPSTVLSIKQIVITVTKISAANQPVRFYNIFNPDIMKRSDAVFISMSSNSERLESLYKIVTDALKLKSSGISAVNNRALASDVLSVGSTDIPNLTNIHTIMKSPSRKVYGKVYITYTDPMLDTDTAITSNYIAYNSNMEQLLDGVKTSEPDLFTLYENDLSGDYRVSDINTQVGWVSGVLSSTGGYFVDTPYLKVAFASRPILSLSVTFDDSHDCIPTDFTIIIGKADNTTITKTVTGNTSKEVSLIDSAISNVVYIQINITRASRAGYPVAILDIPVVSTLLYKGYADESRLMSINLLEELTYEDDIEALGGISANEVTVVLDNSTQEFYFNNTSSPVALHLRRNRKIEPYLGAEVVPGTIEWYKLGTYWSYKWNVPVHSLTATVVGFDTIGLLDTTSYINHTIQVNKSIGELIEYVLDDAKQSMTFIQYSIDSALYDIVIPYAWFDAESHTAALRKISECYPMHIYCDRNGKIVAAPQKLHLDYHYDTWSDSTNIIDKKYSSLYTVLPNIINVTVMNLSVLSDEQLVKDETVFATGVTKTLNFSKPYLSGVSVDIDCDNTVTYTYTAYSWGIQIAFAGTGNIRSIVCYGNAIDTSDTLIITQRNESSIHLDGAVTRDVSSDFIQTEAHANLLINRISTLSENDKYDADVEYRGDIALSIKDPIILNDGIAPINRYNIKRHELFWNGALSGSANLNT